MTAALVTNPLYPVAEGRGHNAVVLAFRPTPEERARLAQGEDLYISLLTFGGPMQGIVVMVGEHEAAGAFRVPVEVAG